jgi:hypothetical protein
MKLRFFWQKSEEKRIQSFLKYRRFAIANLVLARQQPLLKQPVQLALASIQHKQIMAPRLSPPARPSKTLNRVNYPGFGVCGTCVELKQTSLNTLQTELFRTHKRMGSKTFKDDRMAYSRCILILYAVRQPPSYFVHAFT